MENQQIEIIKELIETIIQKLTINAQLEVFGDQEHPQFIIRTNEAGILIGENGQNLSALNHIVKKAVDNRFRQENLERVHFFLDINDYQAKKIEDLKNLAKMSAQRVRFFKKEVAMRPMNAYERRIVHLCLEGYPDITTESTGEDLKRTLVIKPYEV